MKRVNRSWWVAVVTIGIFAASASAENVRESTPLPPREGLGEGWIAENRGAFTPLPTSPLEGERGSHTRSEMRAIRVTSPPGIDGDLSDACWQAAPVYDGFTVQDTDRPSPLKTRVQFAFDADNLYIAIKCDTAPDSLVKAEKVAHDAVDVFRSDSIEVMIDADGDRDEYYHFVTNSSSSRFDRQVTQGGWLGNDEWDGQWRSASRVEKTFYTVEMIIPFSSLGINAQTGSTWMINVCRNVRTVGSANYTSIAPGGAYNAPAKFLSLTGIDTDFSRYMLSAGPPRTAVVFADGKVQVTLALDVRNDAPTANTVNAENWLIDPAEPVYVRSAGAVSLEPSGTRTLNFGPYELAESGRYRNWLVLTDAVTGRPLAIFRSALDIECVPITLRVEEPFYRNTIFATQNLEKVLLAVEVGLEPSALAEATLELQVIPDGETSPVVTQSRQGLTSLNHFSFDNAALPAEGKYLLRIVLNDGQGESLANTEQLLHKLPYKKGEIWHGRDLVFRRDGEPFFPNGAWGVMTPGRNFLLYGIFSGNAPIPGLPGKMKVLYFTSSADHPQIASAAPFSESFIAGLRQRIRAYRDDENLLAWIQPDEPDSSGFTAEKLRQMYDILREEDPYHPVWISNNSIEGVKHYSATADAAVPHPYPPLVPGLRIADCTRLLTMQYEYLAHTSRRKPIGFMHQGFDYGEYVPGRRVPSYDELRGQNLLAIAAGATFLMGFESSSLSPKWSPELTIGLEAVTRELEYLGRAIVAPDAAGKVTSDQDNVVTLMKQVGAEVYLFVTNASNEPRRLTMRVDPLDVTSLAVVCEARRVDVRHGVLTDDFDIWQTHIYTTSAEDPGLKSITEVNAMIEQVYSQRRKPGNLAFQRWSNQSVDISFSSKKGDYPPEPWHICDGITEPREAHFESLYHWTDGTPNESPDWVALRFSQPRRIERIAVYTANQSIREYRIQARQGERWDDLAHGANHVGDLIDHAFSAVTADQVRLLVTATNGPHAIVTEFEVYGQ